jgi:hypothetical protein
MPSQPVAFLRPHVSSAAPSPSAAGPFLCSGQAWNFCLVQREGRRYRLMQREGKPSPAYPKCWSRPSFGGAFSLVPSRRQLRVGLANKSRSSLPSRARPSAAMHGECRPASCRIFSGLVRARRDRMGDAPRHRMADRLWPPDRQCPHGAGLGIFARRRYGARRRTDDCRSAALETLVADGGMSQ